MKWGIKDPWIRWRLTAAISPEMVAFGLIVALAILLLAVVR